MSGNSKHSNLPVSTSPQLYDLYTAVGVEAYDQILIGRLIDEYKRLGGGPLRFLDVCTGTGRLLVKVATAPELLSVTFEAFDLYEDMLLIAEANVKAAGLSGRISVRQADVHALPFPACQFDIVMGRSVVHHWAEPVRAFQEIHRILKPGGVAVIHEPRRDPAAAALQSANDERKSNGVHPFQLEEKYTAAEVRDQLQKSGITKFDIFAPSGGLEALGFEVRIAKKIGTTAR